MLPLLLMLLRAPIELCFIIHRFCCVCKHIQTLERAVLARRSSLEIGSHCCVYCVLYKYICNTQRVMAALTVLLYVHRGASGEKVRRRAATTERDAAVCICITYRISS